MKIGIMQPYFSPYIGYFQLIDAVDIYVNLDHVSFMKRSYMVRNKIKEGVTITLPVHKGSQNVSCGDTYVNFGNNYIEKFFTKIEHIYAKDINYKAVLNQIILPNFVESTITVSAFNLSIIKSICGYLDIKTTIIDTSKSLTDKKKEEGLKEIILKFDCEQYVNAIGGQSLYNKEDFLKSNIDLLFLKTGEVAIDNVYISILDALFRYERLHIIRQLKNYSLI